MTFAIVMSLITLGLYCVQQLGVTLAVGAETILLVAYLQSIRDGVVDDEEKGFARAVRGVKDFGLFFIILSGGAIVANQFFTGQLNDFLSIAVLFKWSLIGIALFLGFIRGSSLTAGLLQGLSAGTWFALFAVHILAPEASWVQLVTFYAIWLVGFSVCWTVLVFALRGRKTEYVAPARSVVASAVPKSAVVITPDRVVEPTQKSDLPQRGEFSAKNSPTSGADAPAYISDKPVSATFVPPVIVTMPKSPPTPVPSISTPPKPQPSIPTPPVPPAVPVAAAMPPAPPKPPPPPPKVPVSAPAAPPPPASWLHVMPKTPEELAQRKTQMP